LPPPMTATFIDPIEFSFIHIRKRLQLLNDCGRLPPKLSHSHIAYTKSRQDFCEGSKVQG